MSSVYPMVCTIQKSTAFHVNFGKKPFRFDLKAYFGKECNKVIQEILSLGIRKEELNKLIASYLYLNGCQKSLAYFEESSNVQRGQTLERLKQIAPIQSLVRAKSANSSASDDDLPALAKTSSGPALTATPGNPAPASAESMFKGFRKKLRSFFSSDASTTTCPDSPDKTPKDKESPDGSTQASAHARDSLQSPCGTRGPAAALGSSDETAFVERTRVKRYILDGRVQEAEEVFREAFGGLYAAHPGVRALFKGLQFVRLFLECPRLSVEYAKVQFTPELQKEKIEFTQTGAMTIKLELKELLGLLVVKDPFKSRFSFLFTREFRTFSADMLNSCTLCRLQY